MEKIKLFVPPDFMSKNYFIPGVTIKDLGEGITIKDQSSKKNFSILGFYLCIITPVNSSARNVRDSITPEVNGMMAEVSQDNFNQFESILNIYGIELREFEAIKNQIKSKSTVKVYAPYTDDEGLLYLFSNGSLVPDFI